MVSAMISCNEYGTDGEPMANVYQITVRGSFDGKSFDLSSVKIVGAE